ncbi:MAG: DUF87 domain-containing protein [Candidatus Pacearchaeota archaeon]
MHHFVIRKGAQKARAKRALTSILIIALIFLVLLFILKSRQSRLVGYTIEQGLTDKDTYAVGELVSINIPISEISEGSSYDVAITKDGVPLQVIQNITAENLPISFTPAEEGNYSIEVVVYQNNSEAARYSKTIGVVSEATNETETQAEAGTSGTQLGISELEIQANQTSGSYSNLTIWDETDLGMPYVNGYGLVYINETIKFFANYTDSVGNPLSFGQCNISFDDSADNSMDYNSSSKLFEYTRVANWSGTGIFNITYNVSCYASDFDWLNLTDNATIREKKISCDVTDESTCYISTAQYIYKPTTISSSDIGKPNLYIYGTGSISSSPGSASFTINLTGNLTIAFGGQIYTPAGNYNSGDITIFADVMTIYGSVWSQGGSQGNPAYYAGKININSTTLKLYGNISSMGLSCNGCYAGNGNTINITTQNLFLYPASSLNTSGGQTQYYNGYPGNAGNIAINSGFINISNSSLDLRGGDASYNYGGNGGSITINSGFINISNSSFNLRGGSTSYGNGGHAGSIAINSEFINISSSSLDLRGGNSYWDRGGNGGNITINSEFINISNSSLDLGGGSCLTNPAYSGYGGTLNLTSSSNLFISESTANVSSPDPSKNGSIYIKRLCGYDRANYIGATPSYQLYSGSEPDSDAIADSCPDNCPTAFNPDQYDFNGNDIGDACETWLDYYLNGQHDWLIDVSEQPVSYQFIYKTLLNQTIPNTAISNFTVWLNNSLYATCSLNPCEGTFSSYGLGSIVPVYAEATSYYYPSANVSGNMTIRDIYINVTSWVGGQQTTNIPAGVAAKFDGYVFYDNGTALAGKTVYIYKDDNLVSTATVNESGYYYAWITFSPADAGNRIIKVNVSDGYGVYGENQTEVWVYLGLIITNITIQGQNTSYPGVDVDDGLANISAIVRKVTGEITSGDWNITVRNSTTSITKHCYGVAQCNVSYSLGPGNELDIGSYDIDFVAWNDSIAPGPTYAYADLIITNLNFDLSLPAYCYLAGTNVTASGYISYAHNNLPLANASIAVYHDSSSAGTAITDQRGFLTKTLTALTAVGNHTLKFNYSDPDRIYGEQSLIYATCHNTTTDFVFDYNLTSGYLNITANYTNYSNSALLQGNFVVNVTSLSMPSSAIKYCNATTLCNLGFFVGEGKEVRGGNVIITVTAENETALYIKSSKAIQSYLQEPTTSIALSPENKVVYDKLAQVYYTNITVNATNAGFGNASNVVIDVKQIGGSYAWGYKILNAPQICTVIEPGQTCSKNFTLEINESIGENQNAVILWNASWQNNDGSIGDAVAQSQVNISGIAYIESVDESSFDVNHSKTAVFYIRVNSSGNADARNLTLSFVPDTLSPSWLSLVWNSTGTQTKPLLCCPLSKDVSCQGQPTYDFIKLTLTIPTYQDPGIYNGSIKVTTGNANNLSIKINVSVLADGRWEWQVPGYAEIGFGTGIKPIFAINITNKGNIPLNFSIAYGGNITGQNFWSAASNPTSFYINKGTNTSLTLSYNAYYVSTSSIGLYNLTINFTNISASPTSNMSLVYVRVLNMPPTIENVSITNISGNHYINIPLDITASVDNDDGATYIDRVWLMLRLPNSSIIQLDNLGTKVNPLFSYTPQATGNYSFVIYANDTSGNRGNYSGSFEVIYDTFSPNITSFVTPFVKLGETALIELNASDDLQLDKAKLKITNFWTNSSFEVLMDSPVQGYYTYLINSNTLGEGDYLVYVEVNDTSNNKANATGFFKVYTEINASGELNDKNQSANFTFCLPNSSICYLNLTLNASYDVIFYSGRADVIIYIGDAMLRFYNVNISQLSNDAIKIKKLPTDISIASYLVTKDGLAVDANFSYDEVLIRFTFDPRYVLNPQNLKIYRCSNYAFYLEQCIGTNETLWEAINASTAGVTVTARLQNLSGFLLVEDRSGVAPPIIVGGRGGAPAAGGGGGGISWSELERLKRELIAALGRAENLELDIGEISKELYPGESVDIKVRIANTANTTQEFLVAISGDVAELVSVSPLKLSLKPKSAEELKVMVAIPEKKKPGLYIGSILISGATTLRIPVTIRVLEPKEKLLDLRLSPIDTKVPPGSNLRIQAELFNLGLGGGRIDVTLLLEVIDPQLLQTVLKKEETIAVETTIARVIEIHIPENMKYGRYIVRGTATYQVKEKTQQATALTYFSVGYPWYKIKILGIPIWLILAVIGFILLNLASLEIYEYEKAKRKRYRVPVEYHLLPQPTERSAWIGHIAETKVRAFLDLDKLQMHTIISGSTGSGKTIAAQDIVEEALMKKIAVIVFDPSAQWTGFLRKCQERYMLKYYPDFHMKLSDAKAFNGNIHEVIDPRQFLDIKKYIVPGEIHIFTLNKLKPKDIDLFVASSIKQIFDMNPKESRELKLLLVYDEVHRLLPKFGGSGEGFIQLERGCREFRKWGIGLILISQVTADFVGAIKANIMTEIQLRTREESDLDRIKLKYGEDMLKSIVKAAIGTGMVVNPEYNRGRPYFVSFRPILHSVTRLSDEELEKYRKYNERIERLEALIEQIAKKKDVFDLRIELKLALDKVKAGNFSMADIYLEGLEARVKKEIEALKIKPLAREIKLVEIKEIKKAVEKAKEERKKYLEKEAKEARQARRADIFAELEEKYKNVKVLLDELKRKGVDVKIEEIELAAIPAAIKSATIKKAKPEARKIVEKLEKIKSRLERKRKY